LIDIHSPLRWHGTLRDEPATLPWGISYEIALTRVDSQDRAVPVRGGLRVTSSPHGKESLPADVHAGDEIAVVAQARLPQMFRDEGAFDWRPYLRSQGVELTAALRRFFQQKSRRQQITITRSFFEFRLQRETFYFPATRKRPPRAASFPNQMVKRCNPTC
jgi:hypothetical protein